MKESDIDDHALGPEEAAEPGKPMDAEPLCPECGGTGVAEAGEACPTCDGTGRAPL